MSDEIKSPFKPLPGVVGSLDRPISLRLQSAYVMLTSDGTDKGGDFKAGGIGFKADGRWTWLPYLDVLQLIKTCQDNKAFFNKQVQSEKSRLDIEGL